jgi:hypothetical protein
MISFMGKIENAHKKEKADAEVGLLPLPPGVL